MEHCIGSAFLSIWYVGILLHAVMLDGILLRSNEVGGIAVSLLRPVF
jgi:hypothetical protein